MCEFCVRHGEGKKWYLQAKNYSSELLNEERLRYTFDFTNHVEQWSARWAREADSALAEGPSSRAAFLARRTEDFKREHFGQIVPLEDVERILEMTVSVVRFPCVCRSALLGRYDARYCYGITTEYPRLADFYRLYPDFSSDLEILTGEDAGQEMRRHDSDGLVHSVWTLITPLIGVLCNCTGRDCLPLYWRSRLGLSLFFKAEYVAKIDMDRCAGCRDCMRFCNFGAISYSASLERCIVNQLACYGCGLCRSACPNDCIALIDRNAIPVLANEW